MDLKALYLQLCVNSLKYGYTEITMYLYYLVLNQRHECLLTQVRIILMKTNDSVIFYII